MKKTQILMIYQIFAHLVSSRRLWVVPAQLRTIDISIVCFKANKAFLNCQNKNDTSIKSIFLVMSSTVTFSPALNTFNIKET